jgi:acylphosphatase
MPTIDRMHLQVTGTVQGVNFRAWTQERARTLGVTGWIHNTTDGAVAGEAHGNAEAVEQLYVPSHLALLLVSTLLGSWDMISRWLLTKNTCSVQALNKGPYMARVEGVELAKDVDVDDEDRTWKSTRFEIRR